MVAPISLHVVFACTRLHTRLAAQLRERGSEGSGGVDCSVIEAEVRDVVRLTREAIADAPLGMIVETEAEVMTAIEAGVDEAIAWSGEGAAALLGFLDRTRLRARQRQERWRRAHELAQTQKLSALGSNVAGVAHEINNPLSVIILSAELLELSIVDAHARLGELERGLGELEARGPKRLDALRAIVEQLNLDAQEAGGLVRELGDSGAHVGRLVDDLRIFSRNERVETPSWFSPREVMEQAFRLVRRKFDKRTIIERDYAEGLPDLYLPRTRLTQVLMNLLVNAAQAVRDTHGSVLRVRLQARVDEDYVALSVADNGPGIPDHVQEQIFHAFFTTKGEREGTGLGLSISRQLVEDMGGELVVSSVYGDGATFMCFLPLPTAGELEAARPAHERPWDAPSTSAVLVVDDDEGVLRAVSRALAGNYGVLLARDGQEAMDLLASGSHADALVMELDLPEVSGPELFDWIERERPQLARRVVVATGAAEHEAFRAFVAQRELPIVLKPLRRDELLQAVHAALERADGR